LPSTAMAQAIQSAGLEARTDDRGQQRFARSEMKAEEVSALEESRSRYRALHDRYCQLLTRHRHLQNRWTGLLVWYETADRSPQSWAELDKIMEGSTPS
jgi:hypothetical protein